MSAVFEGDMSGPAFEPYRVILDYEALQDGFLDRIEDLNTTFEHIEAAGGMPRGSLSKMMCKSQKRVVKALGPKSLEQVLKGTGLVLALVHDDERLRQIRDQLVQRRRAPSINPKTKEKPINIEEIVKLATQARMREIGMKGNKSPKRRAKMMARRARQRKAAHAARMRWKSSRR